MGWTWIERLKGLRAGNVFDWGAKEVAVLMENRELGFEEILNKLQGKGFVYSLKWDGHGLSD